MKILQSIYEFADMKKEINSRSFDKHFNCSCFQIISSMEKQLNFTVLPGRSWIRFKIGGCRIESVDIFLLLDLRKLVKPLSDYRYL